MDARDLGTGFANRDHAGRVLARELRQYAHRRDVLVLGLPRGGVPVAARIAEALDAPLGICGVRKLGVPGHEEYAMGAIASGGVVEMDEAAIRELHISDAAVSSVIQREARELERRERIYQGGAPIPDLRGRIVILVDDGLATGSTMRAAVSSIRRRAPARVIVAVPVASTQACADMAKVADSCVCSTTPEPFHAVGAWYEDFEPTSDEDVLDCLARAREGIAGLAPESDVHADDGRHS